jgi:hypothetical protein
MMPKATVKERIRSSVRASSSVVFLRGDFARFGDYRQVSRALSELQGAGDLVRVGYGVYARARPSTISGRPVPTESLVKIGLEVMKKLGIDADLGSDARALRGGTSTQVPMLPVISVGNSRVSRRIGLGNRRVVYERG